MPIAPLLALLLAAFAAPGNVNKSEPVAAKPVDPESTKTAVADSSAEAKVANEQQSQIVAERQSGALSTDENSHSNSVAKVAFTHESVTVVAPAAVVTVEATASAPTASASEPDKSPAVPPTASAPTTNTKSGDAEKIALAPASVKAAIPAQTTPAEASVPEASAASDAGVDGLNDARMSSAIRLALLSNTPNISVVGTGGLSDAAKPIAEGGRNVRIQLALQRLLPDGYTVSVHPRLEGVVADWNPSGSVDEALSSLRVNTGDVSIVMNADMRLAQVMPAKETAKLIVSSKPIQWDLKMEDGRLDKAIRRWAREAGYSFRWDADRYVLIGAPTSFTGSFESVVEQVLDTPGIKQSEYPLEACVYNNEPPLLRITRLGDQKEECK